jgi:hypothetical protein
MPTWMHVVASMPFLYLLTMISLSLVLQSSHDNQDGK